MSNNMTICDKPVPRIGLGAMRLTGHGVWGDPPDRAGAVSLLKAALEVGVRFIDTADSYGPFTNETLIRDALYPYADDLIIATKGGLKRPAPGVWENDASPRSLRDACIASLRRLGAECIDLYQLHAVDPSIPFEDSVGALAALRSEGKIRHIGLSNVSLDQLRSARRIAAIASVQNRYNLLDRASEAVLAECESCGIPFIPWYPFSAGTHLGETGSDCWQAAHQIAMKHGADTAQIILAWLLQRSAVMLPIPGTASPSHMKANFHALEIRLDTEDLAALDGVSPMH